jgi:hypothetical protein
MIGFFFRLFRREPVQPPDAPADHQENHVDKLLTGLAEKSYDRQNDESESLWRTLPLFPVTFGFAVALLGYAFVSAPSHLDRVFAWAVYVLISLSTLVFLPAFRWLWEMVKPKTFRYLPSDLEILGYANSLRDYHRASASDQAEVDSQVAADLSSYLLREWAAAATHNQRHNERRSYARGRTIFYLLICIALALSTNVLILVGNKFGA